MASEAAARLLIAGTRGSDLARIQTNEVLDRVRAARPGVRIAVQIVRTGGDRDRVTPLSVIGGKGVFVKELERALLDQQIDLAVHSLKDLPPQIEQGLLLAAVTPRADPRDALVSHDRLPLAALPPGARVGTGSARRRAQVLALRPDIEVVEVRGNVDTRIDKALTGEMDAVVLAAAGLERLGRLDEAAEIFPVDVMIPAPGQGALALEVRRDDPEAVVSARAINDPASHLCGLGERAFLARLGAGCTLPAGAYARVDGDRLRMWGMLATPDFSIVRREIVAGPLHETESLGTHLAEALLTACGQADT
jgi:hydroxymethylbilane synthase